MHFQRELGIGIVPYSPIGRGFFGGKAITESLPANSFLVSNDVQILYYKKFTSVSITNNKLQVCFQD